MTKLPSGIAFDDWLSVATPQQIEVLRSNMAKAVYVTDSAIPEWDIGGGTFQSYIYVADVSPQGLQLVMRPPLAKVFPSIVEMIEAAIQKHTL